MINRRRFSMGVGAALIGCGLSGGPRTARAARGWSRELPGDLDKIEAESGGRLGVAVLDTLSGERTGHRADERFPMCSTFKLLAAAAIPHRSALLLVGGLAVFTVAFTVYGVLRGDPER